MTKVETCEQVNISDTDVRSVYKHLTRTLQICGIFIPQQRKGIARLLQWVYSVFILSLLWTNVIRVGIVFRTATGLSESLTSTASMFLMSLGSAYLATTIFLSSTWKLDTVLDAIEEYHREYGYAFKVIRFSKVLTLGCIICLVMAVLYTTGLSFYMIYFPDSKLERYYFPFERMSAAGLPVGIVLVGLESVIASSASFMPVVVFWSFCYSLSKEFIALNQRVSRSTTIGNTDYEDMRQHHLAICRILEKSNNIVMHYLFSLFVISIPIACLMLYGIIVGSMPISDLLVMLGVACNFVWMNFTITAASAYLNTKAHGCLDDLLACRLDSLPTRTLHTISIFTSRLTGPPIGFNVYGLFTISTSTILTILGTLVTYSVVVLQFKPTATAPTAILCPAPNVTVSP